MSYDLAAIGGIGTILAVVVALFSFWWINLRGPSIICSPIRYMTIMRKRSSSFIILKFVLSNVGSSSGVIEYIYLKMNRISPDKTEYEFVPFYDGSIVPLINTNTSLSAFDSPVLPFVIENGKCEKNEITFSNELREINLSKGECILELYVCLRPSHVLLRSLGSFVTGRQMFDQPLKIKLLKQKFTIVNDFQVGETRRVAIKDPLNEKLNI